ncbi:hypothetical protein HJD18_03815 [Thermoleophilia bacterium SCSIO 60948]|nr:hypothetical protein HJD18_03815 [Thermoleophilia bacterium SCSIO 60948]
MAGSEPKVKAANAFRVVFALALTAMGVLVAVSPSLAARNYKLFGGGGEPLSGLVPGFGTFLIVAGVLLAVCGVVSILRSSAVAPAIAGVVAVAIFAGLIGVDSTVAVGTERQTHSVLNVGGTGPLAALAGASGAFLSVVGLLIAHHRPAALIPVFREPSPHQG